MHSFSMKSTITKLVSRLYDPLIDDFKLKVLMQLEDASHLQRGHPLSAHAKFSEKLKFLTPLYACT